MGAKLKNMALTEIMDQVLFFRLAEFILMNLLERSGCRVLTELNHQRFEASRDFPALAFQLDHSQSS